MDNSTSNLDEVEPSDGRYNPELFDTDSDDYDDPSWFELVKAEIETMENFKVIFDNPWGVMRVFHYGTEIGCCYHYGSHLDIETRLIRELDKYDVDLELFLFNHRIKFEYAPLPEKYDVSWTGEHTGVITDGKLNCHFSYNNHKNSFHSSLHPSLETSHIELIYRNRPCCSHWSDYLLIGMQPWFDAIWNDIKINNKQPQKFNLAQRVGSLLPLGYKAYADGFTKAEIYRSRSKYAYITENGNELVVSKSPMPKADSLKLKTISEAVQAALAMIDAM